MNDRQKNESTVTVRRGRFLLLTAIAAVAGAVVTGLLVNIFEHKQEAKDPFFRVVEITDETEDPATWGKNLSRPRTGHRARRQVRGGLATHGAGHRDH